MNALELNRVKNSLLKELNITVQRYYHQRLEEIINDLHVHNIETKPDPSPDELLTMVWKNRILYYTSAPRVVELRGTLERLYGGTFGVCIRCGREISAEILEMQPMTTLCPSCAQSTRGVQAHLGQ